MLTTTRLAQIQLSETIATIAGHNFMSQWHKLKPKADNSLPTNWQLLESLVSFLNPNQQSTDKIVCVLGIIRSITAVYVGKDKTEEMVVQIRYIMKQFVKKLWLRFLGGWAQGAVSNFNHTLSNPPSIANNDKDKEHAKYVIQGLEKLVLIFHDLTSVGKLLLHLFCICTAFVLSCVVVCVCFFDFCRFIVIVLLYIDYHVD